MSAYEQMQFHVDDATWSRVHLLHHRRRRLPDLASSWFYFQVSRVVRQRPLEFVRRKAWTATPVKFRNGIAAVTSLCLCDEASTGGPSVLISGDEDGGVSVLKVEGGGDGSPASRRLAKPEIRRVGLHSSCVNTIKVLPDQRGFVSAGDDGALIAVASFDVTGEEDMRRASFALTGHSSFVTDCDTAESGHAILSSSTDGRMLLWDPLASHMPVATVLVGCPLNSACFSAGDPYALLCAPELGEASSSRHEGAGSERSGRNDDLVQIWDLRYLRCFKDSIPVAIATAFGENPHPPVSCSREGSMQPPPPQSPQVRGTSVWSSDGGSSSGSGTTRRSVARTPTQVPSWLTTALGSTSAASPATPLLRRSTWTDENSDTDSVEKKWYRGRSSLWSCGTPESTRKENTFPASSGSSGLDNKSPPNPISTPSSSVREQGSQRPARMAAPRRDGPFASLHVTSLPACGCLHPKNGKTWVPGGVKTRQASSRRNRTAGARERTEAVCVACSSSNNSSTRATAFSVQVSRDGRGILVASRDRTVTLFDAQSREVVYRFGHPRLSTRARPILVEGDQDAGHGGWGRARGGERSVFGGMLEGEVRCWRVGSQFPNRVFKSAGHHEGFEICSLATSVNGGIFSSADSSGTICVQSATWGGGMQDDGGEEEMHRPRRRVGVNTAAFVR